MAGDRFHFVFSTQDAQAASLARMRWRIGEAFGIREQERLEYGVREEEMMENGYWFDDVSLHWLPSWWPRWSDG